MIPVQGYSHHGNNEWGADMRPVTRQVELQQECIMVTTGQKEPLW